jgi:Rps23 Pro-64 3,4-dihydroxylase Tpa1-like proline 4-hydroxylase
MDELTIDKSYYYGHQSIEKNKYAFNSNFNKNLQELFNELNSDEFISILEHKTGIDKIIRNNLQLKGAGVHKVLNDGFLCMHTDFEGYHDERCGLLDRRLNLLLYMNKDWKDEYNGKLCLYDKTLNKITKKITPILNRCVIFFTPDNLHGHPEPLKIPTNISRQSITTYYYTKNITGKNLDGKDIKPVQWYHDIKEN